MAIEQVLIIKLEVASNSARPMTRLLSSVFGICELRISISGWVGLTIGSLVVKNSAREVARLEGCNVLGFGIELNAIS